jgi:RecA-family ATPase
MSEIIRHTKSFPCPVCHGHIAMPKGSGTRCWGFTSDGGRWTHCTREEQAGAIEKDGTGTFAHLMNGDCKCGKTHGEPFTTPEHSEPTNEDWCKDAVNIQEFALFDDKGKLHAIHKRANFSDGTKNFMLYTPQNEISKGMKVAALPLYNIMYAVRTPAKSIVIICEGEKAADALVKLGFMAVSTVTGANGCPCDDAFRPLVNHSVYLWPDNDKVGRDHMDKIGARLTHLGMEPRVIRWLAAPDKGDAADLSQLPHASKTIARLIACALKWTTFGTMPEIVTADKLLNMELPPIKWIVENIVPSGATIIAGGPKIGKSWAALSIGVAVASGGMALGHIKAVVGDVLALCLEDNHSRLQRRLRVLCPEGLAPARLHTAIKWPKIGEGFAEAVREWAKSVLDARLVIVDTAAKVRKQRTKGADAYLDDYAVFGSLKELADELNIAVIIVHHVRKEKADNVLDTVLGTQGVAGSVDTILVMAKLQTEQAKTVKLTINGRDVEETEKALVWSNESAWTITENLTELEMSEKRHQVLKFLKDHGPAYPKAIAEGLDKNHNTIKTTLHDMLKTDVLKCRNGLYSISDRIESTRSPYREDESTRVNHDETPAISNELTGLTQPTLTTELTKTTTPSIENKAANKPHIIEETVLFKSQVKCPMCFSVDSFDIDGVCLRCHPYPK